MSEILIFIFTKIASTEGFVVAVLILAGILLRQKNIRQAVVLLGTTSGLMLTVQLLKNLFQVPRPPEGIIEASGYAMPSGHAAGSIFLAIVVIFLLRKLPLPLNYFVAAIAIALAFLISGSRIVLKVHTLEQVLVGTAIGLLFTIIFIKLSKPTSKIITG